LLDLKTKGKKKVVQATLKANGWGKLYSPLWKLKWLHDDFYTSFSICSLHLLLLGVGKVHTYIHNSALTLHALTQIQRHNYTVPHPLHVTEYGPRCCAAV
jgi:hypothetical protein